VLTSCPPALALIARTTLESLPRLSEVLNLRVEDLGPDYVTILQTKNGKTRRVPLTPELRAELVAHAHRKGYIFGQGREGKPPRQEAISVALGRLMRSIGLDDVTHHVLRHTGASAMVAAGISLRVVQDIGGWSTLRMLERYAHPSGPEMSRAVRVLTEYTATGTKTGTATKTDQGAPKKRGRISAVKSGVTKVRPQGDSRCVTYRLSMGFGSRSERKRSRRVVGRAGSEAFVALSRGGDPCTRFFSRFCCVHRLLQTHLKAGTGLNA
jgi:hypothetical protein